MNSVPDEFVVSLMQDSLELWDSRSRGGGVGLLPSPFPSIPSPCISHEVSGPVALLFPLGRKGRDL